MSSLLALISDENEQVRISHHSRFFEGLLITYCLAASAPTSPTSTDDKSDVITSDEDDEEDYRDDLDFYGNAKILPVVPQEWHDDHWDLLEEYSPWRKLEVGESWYPNWVSVGEKSIPSDKLYQNPDSQIVLKKLTALRLDECPTLDRDISPGKTLIPLFNDSNGDEYQCRINFLDRLTMIACPTGRTNSETAHGFINEIRLRRPSCVDANGAQKIPKYTIPLGSLVARTTARYLEMWGGPQPITELMDYHVMIDIGNPHMPVWILISHVQLRDHVEEDGDNIPQLPIFRGLMMNEEYGYDAACILSSVHEISPDPSKLRDFEAVLERVFRTRSVSDPGSLPVLKVDVERIIEEAESVEALKAAQLTASSGTSSTASMENPSKRWSWRSVPKLIRDKVSLLYATRR
jgi:hypothetical protein